MPLTSVWVVVPAYNEESTISGVVSSLLRLACLSVCVVDDGSADGTRYRAHEAGAYVVRHIANLGQGAALQTGIDYALAKGAEYICTCDADGQHSAQAVNDLLIALERSGAAVALGSRFLGDEERVPLLRKYLLKMALAFTRFHARLDVTDTHNGLRALSREAAEAIRIDQPQMAHASEILQKLGAAKLKFLEVPVRIDYTAYSRKKGQSGFDSVKILLDLLYRSIALRH